MTIEAHPDAYLDELAKTLGTSSSTISYTLKKLNITRKKTTLYEERDPENRRTFEQVLETLEPTQLVYVDECGLNESIRRDYARSPKGKQVQDDITGKRTARTSIIAGLNQGKPVAPLYFQGYCNTEVVFQWMKDVLLPELKLGMTVIWDNASFHQSPEFKTLIESRGCTLLFLPPYSPDLNPIEQWWSALKARIRRLRKWAKLTIAEALDYLFKDTH